MKLLPRIKRKLKKVFSSEQQINTVIQVPSCEQRLAHLAGLNYTPAVIFDCGAFIGRWAAEVADIFKSANIVMIEPNSDLYEQIYDKTSGVSDRVQLVEAAVGESPGEMELNIWENSQHKSQTTALAASSLLGHVQGEASKKLMVDVRTVDQIMTDTGLTPNLLKLDLQGAELPALKGAENALLSCELCIIEFGCLEAYKDRTTPNDLISFMYERNYVLYDIVDIRYRPFDGALMGGDFFFVKRSSILRDHKDYF